ncbi:tripartite-type tricarboxylate transporter receptor subunit TctC [Pseudacidovorax intermedius]|uniref:Tripartite-type tricarboxylate transporter receptor subunit TctC n=3 Tax=Pseudacidovorax intermedius TaxID=433924 RepID=A0A370FDD0_9BURK|nr:tripartite tricarboxylate transporter substrate binding protein [Pseudacidovorax intermedius]RDI23445.1 tripartite-type tricarboxylate transporter receptor subunit TctC [Pseudacidovorax intermedius]
MNRFPPLHRRTWLAAALAAAATLPGLAQAQTYPAKPVTFVVPFAAGSATDQLARALGQSFTEQTGQSVVVDNRAGASGMIAAQYVAKAAADGYMVLITTNTTHAANEHLYRKLPYDPVKDFAPITGLGKGGQVLVVNASAPYKNVGELLAAAKKNPGKLSFGSGSSSSRVAGEMLKQMAQVDILHVPYKSNPLAITDLLGGQIDMMITDTSTGVPQIKAGKLRALGYSTQKRSTQLPDVPTLDEAGVKGYDMGYWFAAYAPAGTPAPVVAKLNEVLGKATKSAAAKSFFDGAGSEAWTTTPDELAKFQAGETRKWGQVIKAAGIEAE